jgi:hypothetical protein
MSINSSVNIERQIIHQDFSGDSNTTNHLLLTNNFLSRIGFLTITHPPLTQAGRYDQTINMPKPMKAWHRASKGTTERFEGCLTKLFPELTDLSEKDLKEIEKKRHEF